MRTAINPRSVDLPHVNAVLNGVIRREYVVTDYRTTLSIKAVVSGEARYETPSGRYLVTPDVFLVLNHDQHYWMDVDGSARTETVCPFFAPGFLEKAAAPQSLDDPEVRVPVEFVERLYPVSGEVGAIVLSIHRAIRDRRAEPAWLDDRFHDLAGALLSLRDDARREAASFPGLRPSTREELYRRLCRARDFIHSCFAQPLTVGEIARIAALSPFHLHRTFRQAFGVTPMQFLQRRRLEVARALLLAGMPVTMTASSVGFESLGSFSALFRRRFGVPPGSLRKKQD